MSNFVEIQVNDQKIKTLPDQTIIQVCHDHDIDVPYYCYHKNLSIAGNCRMCLVKVEKIPKLVVACATPIHDGMIVDTQCDEVVQARHNIMEFLLINHPLDCPVCDQSGECKLQDYSYNYGQSLGRFKEEKVIRKIKDFGNYVKYWGTRCIVCTRCVRFTDEISGTGELAVLYRGDHSSIDYIPTENIRDPLFMNVVDICPVGALVSSDFLFQARVWFMKEKESICLECSVGCNTTVGSLNNQIKRITPRENQDINLSFMCDHGRLSFEYIQSPKRIKFPKCQNQIASWEKAIQSTKNLIQNHPKTSNPNIVFLVSSWTDNETLLLIQKLQKYLSHLSLDVYFFSRPQEKDQTFPKFRISGDKNPNQRGIKNIFGQIYYQNHQIENLVSSIQQNNQIHILFFVGGIPNFELPKPFLDSLQCVQDIITIDHSKSQISEQASIVLPSLTFAEKSGTYVNDQNITQKINPSIQPLTPGQSESLIFQNIISCLQN